MYPLNSAYSKWVNDSLTFKHILQDFGEYLPKYYYHIIMRDGRPLVIRLMDLPDSYSANMTIYFVCSERRGICYFGPQDRMERFIICNMPTIAVGII